ncbi:hypothetical protein [Xanthomonas arboricola]|uniref:hypothetical protein n=1 Tax=Xanthomonas arboricola TaxID=56448 RepID=UPI0021578421|nr:hypothetical protein [Xanthomonas arboricola]
MNLESLFAFSEYERMADLMRSCRGKTVVSLNGHADIRRLFADFETVPLQVNYTTGSAGTRDKQFGELIIKSWDDRASRLL